MRWNRHRRDTTHKEIVEALRKCGCSVRDVSQSTGTGGSDLIVGLCGRDFQVECKSEGQMLSNEQVWFYDGWSGADLTVLRSAEDAVAWAVATRKRIIGQFNEET